MIKDYSFALLFFGGTVCYSARSQRSATRSRKSQSSEPEVSADHGLGGKGVGRLENCGQFRSLIQIATVVKAQADVREQTPVKTRAVNGY
jgi:hypothetical protein